MILEESHPAKRIWTHVQVRNAEALLAWQRKRMFGYTAPDAWHHYLRREINITLDLKRLSALRFLAELEAKRLKSKAYHNVVLWRNYAHISKHR